MTIFSSRFFVFFAALAVIATGFVSSARAEDAAAAPAFTDAQKAEVNDLVKTYIKEHPQEIINALNKLQTDQAAKQDENANAKLGEHMAFLTSADAPSAGNPKGDVTVVEFFDYNCGYCKRALPDIKKVVDGDKNVRVIFHEMPILGPTSLTAAQWALAAHKQGKYFEFHKAVMDSAGPKDADSLAAISKDLGLDVEKMKKDAASPEVQKMIDDSMTVARDLNINGTPAFIVNQTVARGYMGPDGLEKAIASEREKAKK